MTEFIQNASLGIQLLFWFIPGLIVGIIYFLADDLSDWKWMKLKQKIKSILRIIYFTIFGWISFFICILVLVFMFANWLDD